VDRSLEVGQRHLGERDALDVTRGDHADRDVDTPGTRGHGVHKRIDPVLVERVDNVGVGRATGRADVVGDGIECG